MQDKTEVYSLILSGGKSTRMGNDKGLLTYHGVPQREYLYQMAKQFCSKTFYSIRSGQEAEFETGADFIVDKNEYKGPLNGILSAHKAHPNVAWLVLACDLPLLNEMALRALLTARNPNKIATAFATNKTGLPEPLVAIWEPNGLKKAMEYMETAGSSCPRKFLISSDVVLVHPKNDEVLYNANTLEEFNFAKSKLAK